MADLTVWPTDGADGAVSSEARWRKMARGWAVSGVDTSLLGIAGQLAPTLVAGPAIQVAAGSCWLDGHYAELLAPVTIPASASGLLCVRFTPADNHAELVYRDAATVLTQTLATWELPVAQMIGGVLRDLRWFANTRGEIAKAEDGTNVGVPSLTPPTAPITIDDLPGVYCDGGLLEVEFAAGAVGISAAGGLLYVRLWLDAAEATGVAANSSNLLSTYANLASQTFGRCRVQPAAGVHQFRSRGSLAGTAAGTTGAINIWHQLTVRRV